MSTSACHIHINKTSLESVLTFSWQSHILPNPLIAQIGTFFRDEFYHTGSWTGCGGNPMAGKHVDCTGMGNCGPGCVGCGKETHWSCCGASDMKQKFCDALDESSGDADSDICYALTNPAVRPSYDGKILRRRDDGNAATTVVCGDGKKLEKKCIVT